MFGEEVDVGQQRQRQRPLKGAGSVFAQDELPGDLGAGRRREGELANTVDERLLQLDEAPASLVRLTVVAPQLLR